MNYQTLLHYIFVFCALGPLQAMEEEDEARKRNYLTAFAEPNVPLKDEDADRPRKKPCPQVTSEADDPPNIHNASEHITDLIKKGQLEQLQSLYKATSDLDKTAIFNERALYCAVSQGQLEIVKYFCQNIPGIIQEFSASGMGRNAFLQCAALNGQFEILTYFCQNYPDLILKGDRDGETVLHAAVRGGRFEIVKYLCENYPALIPRANDYKYTALHAAADSGELEVLEYFCQNFPNLILKVNHAENTALHLATLEGHLKIVTYLCQNHPDLILMIDDDGSTALHLASRRGHFEIVKYLCRNHRALIPMADREGNTALHWAAGKRRLEVLKYLCQNHRDFLFKFNGSKDTALHLGVRKGHLGVVKYLCPHYSGLLPVEGEGGINAALSLAAQKDQLAILKILCIHFPSAGLSPFATPLNSAVTQLVIKFNDIYTMGLVGKSSGNMPASYLAPLRRVDANLLAKILRYQPLDIKRDNKIIVALNALMDKARFKRERIIKALSASYLLSLAKEYPSKMGERDQIRAYCDNKLQNFLSKYQEGAEHIMPLIRLYQAHRVPSLKSLALNAITELLLIKDSEDDSRRYLSPENYFTLFYDLARLAVEAKDSFDLRSIAPPIRLYADTLLEYLETVRLKVREERIM